VLVALLLASPALAARERFVSPGGSGTACSQDRPCALTYALSPTALGDGDDVTIAPGDYDVGGVTG
jgi:hypothetical protein